MIPFYLQPRFWLECAAAGALAILTLYIANLHGKINRAEKATEACTLAQSQHALADAQAGKDALEAQRVKDAAHADEMAALDAANTQRRQDDEARIAALDADVRAGRVKLRQHFTCPAQAGGDPAKAAASAGAADDAALLREKSAGDLVRIGAECDRQVRGLQQAVRVGR